MAPRNDPVAEVLRLDAHRGTGWRRIHDHLANERQRRVDHLVRGVSDYDTYLGLAGECRGIDLVLAALKKEYVN